MEDHERAILGAISHPNKKLQEVPAEKPPESGESSNLFWILVSLCFFVAIAIMIGWSFSKTPQTYSNGVVHWHALVNITICGEHRDLPRVSESGDEVHGARYLGTPILHTHDDNTIHVEGVIEKKEDISLGSFFDAIGVPFDSNKIMNVTNGDLCNGVPASLSMTVNSLPRTDFRDYIVQPTQKASEQVIELIFE